MKDLSQIAITTGIIVSTILTIGWKAYAEDKIDSQIVEKLKPIAQKVDSNSKRIEQVDYQGKQMLYLIKQMAGKKAVAEMEEQTRIFKPEAQ